MNRSNFALKAAIAAGLGLASMAATAGTTVFATAANYAVEGIPSTGAVTIPAGVTYTTAAGAAESGLLKITLPAGVTFTSTPALAVDGAIVTVATVSGGGTGSNSLTINYTRTAAAGGTITVGAFTATGATALSTVTAAGAFQYTAQSSGFVTAANNDANPIPADLATSSKQLVVTPGKRTLTIDVPNPSNATRWLASAVSVATSGSIGTLLVANGGAVKADATGPFTFTSATASVVLNGDFTGVTSAYLAPFAVPCAATAPAGATSGAVAANAITFSAVTPAFIARTVCLGATGSTILRQSSGIPAAATQDTFTTVANVGGIATDLGPVNYNGSVTSINYVVGSTGGYSNYLRVVNRGAAPTDIRLVVQADNGTINTGLLATVPANQSALYSVADINTATGSSLSSSTDRAAITVLAPNFSVESDNIMGNPDGSVVPMP